VQQLIFPANHVIGNGEPLQLLGSQCHVPETETKQSESPNLLVVLFLRIFSLLVDNVDSQLVKAFLEKVAASSLLVKQVGSLIVDRFCLPVPPSLEVARNHVGGFWHQVVHEACCFEFHLTAVVKERCVNSCLRQHVGSLLEHGYDAFVSLWLLLVSSQGFEDTFVMYLLKEALLNLMVDFADAQSVDVGEPRLEDFAQEYLIWEPAFNAGVDPSLCRSVQNFQSLAFFVD
jgi:hypothetical protein